MLPSNNDICAYIYELLDLGLHRCKQCFSERQQLNDAPIFYPSGEEELFRYRRSLDFLGVRRRSAN